MNNLNILKSLYGVKYPHGSVSISALMHLRARRQTRILKNKLKKKKKNKSFQSLFPKVLI